MGKEGGGYDGTARTLQRRRRMKDTGRVDDEGRVVLKRVDLMEEFFTRCISDLVHSRSTLGGGCTSSGGGSLNVSVYP